MFGRSASRLFRFNIKNSRSFTSSQPRLQTRTHCSSTYKHGAPPSLRTHIVVLRTTSSNLVLLLAISAAILGCGTTLYQYYLPPSPALVGTKDVAPQLSEQTALMAGAPLPGRPDNLTTEQEEKLKEFWIALFRVFGLSNVPEGHEGVDMRPASQKANEEANATTKPKRKSLFGSKHDDSKSERSSTPVQGEDKYGQNKEFHKILETSSAEELRQAFWSMVKCDNPDALLLRFLRARKWNVQNALAMLIATIQWRLSEVKVDSDIVRKGELGALEDSESADAGVKREGHDFLEQLRIGKSYLHGTDKDGRPMCFVRVRLHRAGEQTEKSLERYTVYTIESARLLLHDNVDTAAIVFDMTDFSMANMDYAPVKFMIKCFEANYPESLGVVLVYKSPWIFQSIWKIIKGWLDPVVAAKVHFTKDLEELSHFVPLDHIPEDMGGKEPWKYSFVPPVKGENDQLEDTAARDQLLEQRTTVVQDYEATTLRWLNGNTDDDDKRRKELTDKLRSGYWELDPHVRAKTLYDRTGVIRPGGGLDFYPSARKEGPALNGGPVPAGHDDDGVE